MKNALKTICFVLSLSILVLGCSDEKTGNIEDDTLSSDFLDGLSINIGVDMTKAYDLSKVSLEDILKNTIKALYEEDLSEAFMMRDGDSQQDENLSFVAVDFHVSDNQVIVTTTTGDDVDNLTDNEKCGGQSGDGWKSYGLCLTKSCVETKSGEAARELSLSLQSGKCLDIRVKRNALNARVCCRIVSC